MIEIIVANVGDAVPLQQEGYVTVDVSQWTKFHPRYSLQVERKILEDFNRRWDLRIKNATFPPLKMRLIERRKNARMVLFRDQTRKRARANEEAAEKYHQWLLGVLPMRGAEWDRFFDVLKKAVAWNPKKGKFDEQNIALLCREYAPRWGKAEVEPRIWDWARIAPPRRDFRSHAEVIARALRWMLSQPGVWDELHRKPIKKDDMTRDEWEGELGQAYRQADREPPGELYLFNRNFRSFQGPRRKRAEQKELALNWLRDHDMLEVLPEPQEDVENEREYVRLAIDNHPAIYVGGTKKVRLGNMPYDVHKDAHVNA